MKVSPELSERINTCIKRSGMTQKELAERIHVTPVHLNNIIKGRKGMTLEIAEAAASALGVDRDYLLGVTDYTMTVRDGVDLLNEQVKKCCKEGMYAAVVMLVGTDDGFLSEDDLHRLDELRGNKLNLIHKESWRPEEITREDAELIRKGLDVYRDVLWQIHGKNIMERIAKSMAENIGKGEGDDG